MMLRISFIVLLAFGLCSAKISGVVKDSLIDSTIYTSMAYKSGDQNYALVLNTRAQNNAIIYQVNKDGTLLKKYSDTLPQLSARESAALSDTCLYIVSDASAINKYSINASSGITLKTSLPLDSLNKYIPTEVMLMYDLNIAVLNDTCTMVSTVVSNMGYPLANGPYSYELYLFRISFSDNVPKVMNRLNLGSISPRVNSLKILLIENSRAVVSLSEGNNGIFIVDLNTMVINSFYKPSAFYSAVNTFTNATVNKGNLLYYASGTGFGTYEISTADTLTRIDSTRLSNTVSDLTLFSTGTKSFMACGLYPLGKTAFFSLDNDRKPSNESFYLNTYFTGTCTRPFITAVDSVLLIVCKPGIKSVLTANEESTPVISGNTNKAVRNSAKITKTLWISRPVVGTTYNILGRSLTSTKPQSHGILINFRK
jgi:hypothetical protein